MAALRSKPGVAIREILLRSGLAASSRNGLLAAFLESIHRQAEAGTTPAKAA